MHNLNERSNHLSQQQISTIPNQGSNRNAGEFKASPIRESLIRDMGAFILGNGN